MPSEYRYNRVTKYKAIMCLVQPMHVGGSEGNEEVMVHPVDGKPFVQASGLAGSFRFYAEKVHSDQAEVLYGAQKNSDQYKPGRVRFDDGIFLGNMGSNSGKNRSPLLELRPHVRIDPETGSAFSSLKKGTDRSAGSKFNMEYIGAGTCLSLSFYCMGSGKEDEADSMLVETVAAFDRGILQIGGQKSNGCGFVKVEKLLKKTFDLTDPKGRELWAKEDEIPDQEMDEITGTLNQYSLQHEEDVQITVSGKADSLLVKAIAVRNDEQSGKEVPDAVNIRNAAREYIVPATSIKGVIRTRIEKIAGYLDQQKKTKVYRELAEHVYGKASQEQEEGMCGCICFYDAVVGDRTQNEKAAIQKRIHLDKFTGGVFDRGLFSEKYISGDVEFRITLRGNEDLKAMTGLLTMALRDLACEQVTVGSGFGIGKGVIRVSTIRIEKEDDGREFVIDFENQKVTDTSSLLEECFASLRQKGGSV